MLLIMNLCVICIEDGKKVKVEEMKPKERKKLRKQLRTNYVLSHEAKKLWEDLRR